jgi:hypothetical protein
MAGGHPFTIQVGTGDRVSGDIEGQLRDLKASFPAVFARETPRLVRIEVRPDVVIAVLADPPAEIPCPRHDVAAALGEEFRRAVDARFRGKPSDVIAPADAGEWFDWIRLQAVSHDAITLDVLRFAGTEAGTHTTAARHWLVEQADDLSRRGVEMAPPPPDLVRVHEAYVRWLVVAAPTFTTDDRAEIVQPLARFPPDATDDPYGYVAESRRRWHFDGFDIIGFCLTWPDTIAPCARGAAGTKDATAHLAAALGTRADPALVDAVFAALRSDRAHAQAVLGALAPYPRVQQMARASLDR